LATIEHLCRLGAKWIPDPDETTRHTRDRFRKISPEHVLALFRIFKETNAASIELLDSVLESPALRKSLASRLSSIEELLHPKPRKSAVSDKSIEPKAKSVPPTLAEVRKRARELLLDVVRQEPSRHFTRDAASTVHDGNPFKRKLGMPTDDNRDVQPIVDEASEQLNRRLRSFHTKVEWWGRANCRLTAALNANAEWADALEEAWSFAETANESQLTDVALDLRTLICGGELGSEWHKERSITFKIGLYGRERVLSGVSG
jgi:hypothetical protein